MENADHSGVTTLQPQYLRPIIYRDFFTYDKISTLIYVENGMKRNETQPKRCATLYVYNNSTDERWP